MKATVAEVIALVYSENCTLYSPFSTSAIGLLAYMSDVHVVSRVNIIMLILCDCTFNGVYWAAASRAGRGLEIVTAVFN